MSVVSDVVLMMSILEDDEEIGAPEALVNILDWFKHLGKGRLIRVDGDFGGNKVAQVRCYAGSFNHLPQLEFVDLVLRQHWSDPENLVLLINPEEGPTMVFRPIGWDTRTPESDRERLQQQGR